MVKKIETFEKIERLISDISSNSIKPGLGRVAKLLKELGNPERRIQAIHVLGTNGKGSTACFIKSILEETGARVALYSSPHIHHFGERLVIGDEPVDSAIWLDKLDEVEKILKKINDRPSFFEVSTAIAFSVLAEADVDFAVIEAGLGGRLDATNIVPNVLVSVFTDIAMDHQEFLGDDILSIAKEKFSALRPQGRSCYIGGEPSVEDLYITISQRLGNEGHLVVREWEFRLKKMDLAGTVFDIYTPNGPFEDLKVSLKGIHQIRNAANALMAIKLLEKEGTITVSEKDIRKGFLKAKWPGRFDVVEKNGKTIILDGAHNPHGMAALVSSMKNILPNVKPSILFAAMKDKDYAESLKILKEIKGDLFAVSVPGMDRSERPENLVSTASRIGWEGRCEPVDDLQSALIKAMKRNDIILCCGSLYLIDRLYKLL
jgi:dihydrofolate synthase/folylpolyglutamate synthase